MTNDERMTKLEARKRHCCPKARRPALLYCNCIYRLDLLDRFALCFAFARLPRPDMKAAMKADGNFPRAPNPFAFPKAAIENIVAANVGFGPITFAVGGIIASFDK